MLREKEKVVQNFLAIVDVIIAIVAFNIALYIHFERFDYLHDKDAVILHFVILTAWYVLSKVFRMNEIYRSRPYSVLMLNVFATTILGSALVGLVEFVFELYYIGFEPIITFAGLAFLIAYAQKSFLYAYLKRARKRGLNTRSILIVGDKSARIFINQLLRHGEWGYKIAGIIGTKELEETHGAIAPFLPQDADVDQILANKAIDEVIYIYEKARMEDIMTLLGSCNEVGVVFRMSSPIFNVLSNKTHMHYFSTTPMLTISNTPMDYLALKVKAVFDFIVSLVTVSLLSPVYIGIALIIKLTSKGPVFFKQKRVGIRGRKFWVYKFRTMVVNAEELKEDLMKFNEMDGPTFKMKKDPRITGIGHFLRRTSLDELPQFFNVIMGDMAIVGPRPPVPAEVKDYERWQLRRLSMKPGITCSWQVSSARNDISFDDWMKMDLDYIDNWSLRLDFIIILKTIRTMVRADGR